MDADGEMSGQELPPLAESAGCAAVSGVLLLVGSGPWLLKSKAVSVSPIAARDAYLGSVLQGRRAGSRGHEWSA